MRAEIVVALAMLAAVGAVGCGGDDPAAKAPAASTTAATGTTAAKQTAGADGCTPQAAGAYRIPVEEGRIPVILHVPPGKPPRGGRWPIVVQLPGAGQDGVFAERYTGESALADREGFMVAYPTANGTRPFWNVSGRTRGLPDDVAYMRKVLERLSGPNICADPDRIYVTGASNGGGMTAVLACAAPDLIAAAAPVAGGYSSLPKCRSKTAVPLLEVHSLDDKAVPYGGKGADRAGAVPTFLAEWRARNGCAGTVRRSAPARDVVEMRWTCDGAPVEHVRLAKEPHGWYGGASLDADSTTARTWRFLKAHRLDTKD
jgi:polyhydroxybutyrate depolymerase